MAQIQLTFPAADLTPVPVPASWLDIQGVLNVTFGDVAVSNLGDQLTVAQVQRLPPPSESAPRLPLPPALPPWQQQALHQHRRLLDAGCAGKKHLHRGLLPLPRQQLYLGRQQRSTQEPDRPRVAYGAPLPATNDGPHRYMQLVFQQFDNFTAPSTPAANAPIQRLELQDYYNNANGGLGKIVAANYIQIEVGEGTAPSSTAPVSQASVTALAASKSSAGATGSSSAPASTARPAARRAPTLLRPCSAPFR